MCVCACVCERGSMCLCIQDGLLFPVIFVWYIRPQYIRKAEVVIELRCPTCQACYIYLHGKDTLERIIVLPFFVPLYPALNEPLTIDTESTRFRSKYIKHTCACMQQEAINKYKKE